MLRVVCQTQADVLLLDIMMPKGNGLELIPAIHNAQPTMKILALTMLLDRTIANAALSAGADGFVPKDAPLEELELAVEEVLAGHRYLSPRVPKTSHRVGPPAAHPALANLTRRQQQVFLLIGEGRTETDIADLLGLSLSGVAFHKRNLMRKLGATTDAGLLTLAVLFRNSLQGGAR